MRNQKQLNYSIVSYALSAAAGLSALLVAAKAGAQSDSSSPQPWAVRADVLVFSAPGPFGSAVGAVGGTVQRKLVDRLAIEGSVGFGVGNGQVDGKDAAGWTMAGTVRTSPLMSRSGFHALSFAAGMASFVAGGYGDLHFAFAELGYELRGVEVDGPTLLIAAGPNVLLSSPKKATCEDTSWLSFCQEFKQGEVAPLGHLRLGLGWTF